MKNRFDIELVSDSDFEGMVVDISLGEHTIAHLNYDKGIDKIEIELESFSSNLLEPKVLFPLTEFLEALSKAKELLVKSYCEDQTRSDENLP